MKKGKPKPKPYKWLDPRVSMPLALCAMLALSGCAGMTAQQKDKAAAGALLALEIAAVGVAGVPGADPTTQYWSRYLAGAASQFKGAMVNPTTGSTPQAGQ